MDYVDIEAKMDFFPNVVGFLRDEAKIVSAISGSNYPKSDLEIDLESFGKKFREDMDYLEVELKADSLPFPRTRYFAFRDQGCESRETSWELKKRCKGFHNFRVIVKVEYANRHEFTLTIRNIGVGKGDKYKYQDGELTKA